MRGYSELYTSSSSSDDNYFKHDKLCEIALCERQFLPLLPRVRQPGMIAVGDENLPPAIAAITQQSQMAHHTSCDHEVMRTTIARLLLTACQDSAKVQQRSVFALNIVVVMPVATALH